MNILRVNVNLKYSEENVIRSIPACDIVIGKRKDKAVRLFYIDKNQQRKT